MKWILPLFTALLFAGCSPQETKTSPKGRPVVYTVNYPLAYFAERIAGDSIEIVFPEMEGDPAFWEPTPDQVAAFQQADLILLNGADYAKWVPKVSLPQNRLVNTSQGLEEQFVAIDGVAMHIHGPGGAHAHGDIAFTTWLDPELAIQQAKVIHAESSKHWNIGSGGLDALVRDLRKLDESLKEVFQPLEDRPLLGSHPVYQYLARRYDLNMKSVHWEPDAEPDSTMWRELEDIQEAHAAKIMLWEDEPLPQVKKALLEKGITSIVFNPCGNRPKGGDYLSVMRDNLHAVKALY